MLTLMIEYAVTSVALVAIYLFGLHRGLTIARREKDDPPSRR